jgi:hypothetical protein
VPGFFIVGAFVARLFFPDLLISRLVLFLMTLSYFAASGLLYGYETFGAPYFY